MTTMIFPYRGLRVTVQSTQAMLHLVRYETTWNLPKNFLALMEILQDIVEAAELQELRQLTRNVVLDVAGAHKCTLERFNTVNPVGNFDQKLMGTMVLAFNSTVLARNDARQLIHTRKVILRKLDKLTIEYAKTFGITLDDDGSPKVPAKGRWAKLNVAIPPG